MLRPLHATLKHRRCDNSVRRKSGWLLTLDDAFPRHLTFGQSRIPLHCNRDCNIASFCKGDDATHTKKTVCFTTLAWGSKHSPLGGNTPLRNKKSRNRQSTPSHCPRAHNAIIRYRRSLISSSPRPAPTPAPPSPPYLDVDLVLQGVGLHVPGESHLLVSKQLPVNSDGRAKAKGERQTSHQHFSQRKNSDDRWEFGLFHCIYSYMQALLIHQRAAHQKVPSFHDATTPTVDRPGLSRSVLHDQSSSQCTENHSRGTNVLPRLSTVFSLPKIPISQMRGLLNCKEKPPRVISPPPPPVWPGT